MGRRSDHTRIELEELFVAEGRRQLAETGLARFSAREVAKRVGYSIGTLYNVFGSYDGLMLALNARTLALWAQHLRDRLAAAGDDRIRALVCGYFEFARDNPKAWIAIYEHHMADGGPAPESYQALAADLMSVAAGEVARELPEAAAEAVLALTRSLVATVHGHCAFALYRTFSMLGETAPADAALARVRETLEAAKTRDR
ncbi:TetR/AcrR family transcriptional regulator [Caulobacter sp. S45]|uniref:TetR/AcrR family transcriptional regulator n=1 Tax=Caulobacter sp. S45 TaxID=1641861 RepID=UPI001575E252|nr:TetR/AcrR family transcriptional regulator [Caulobacter sp. S45]